MYAYIHTSFIAPSCNVDGWFQGTHCSHVWMHASIRICAYRKACLMHMDLFLSALTLCLWNGELKYPIHYMPRGWMRRYAINTIGMITKKSFVWDEAWPRDAMETVHLVATCGHHQGSVCRWLATKTFTMSYIETTYRRKLTQPAPPFPPITVTLERSMNLLLSSIFLTKLLLAGVGALSYRCIPERNEYGMRFYDEAH